MQASYLDKDFLLGKGKNRNSDITIEEKKKEEFTAHELFFTTVNNREFCEMAIRKISLSLV